MLPVSDALRAVAPDVAIRAAAVWSMRARAELEAALRFERLVGRLQSVGAAGIVVEMSRTAAADERRHHVMCTELAARLACTTETNAPVERQREPREVAPASLPLRERVLYEVVALSCITESLSAALLGEIVERADDPDVLATARQVLRDEIEHGRLGWAHLAAEHARGDCGFLGAYLAAMLTGAVGDDLFSATVEDGTPVERELECLGVLARGTSADVFSAAMTTVVFPGLAKFGVDVSAGEQWMAERRDARG